jgi:hypothetical protein
MTNFKTCNNGHNYDATKHALCPFCPDSKQNSDYDETMKEFKKTQLINDGNSSQFDKTMIIENTEYFKTTLNGEAGASENPFNSNTNDSKPGTKEESALSKSEKRKIAGWLVTFTNDEYGKDYKLYAGENRIGSGTNNDLVINDPSISGQHVTIQVLDNGILLKNTFSTNSTKVNGTLCNEGKLNDNDQIILGNTTFKLKTIA